MTAYLLDIKEAIDIPSAMYEAVRRAPAEPHTLLLRHKEGPCIVRGGSESLNAEHSQIVTPYGVSVVRRPDGGGTFYHFNQTNCYSRVRVLEDHETNNEELQREWGREVAKYLEPETGPLKYGNSDLYEGSTGSLGRQVVGLSAWHTKVNGHRVRLERACWFEEENFETMFRALGEPMLRYDGEDPDVFLERAKAVPSPKNYSSHLDKIASDHATTAGPTPALGYTGITATREGRKLQGLQKFKDPRSCVTSQRVGLENLL